MVSALNPVQYSAKEMQFFALDLAARYSDLEDNVLVAIALDDRRPIKQRFAAYKEESKRVFESGFSDYRDVCAFIGWTRDLLATVPPEFDNFTGSICWDMLQAEDIAKEFEREYSAYLADHAWAWGA